MSDETLSFRKAPDVTCYDNNIANGSVARYTAHSQAYGKIIQPRPTTPKVSGGKCDPTCYVGAAARGYSFLADLV